MIVTEKLGVLKLNHHRNITLLHTALNCTQMMCVMTCSAERGIHQETIELVQKKYIITGNITDTLRELEMHVAGNPMNTKQILPSSY